MEIKKFEQILGKLSGFTLLSPSKIERVSLIEIVKEVIDFFELEFSRKHIDIQIDMKEDIHMKVERVQIFEVLFNLISNSAESMKTGMIKITGAKEAFFVKITVSDTGKGIPQENIPRVTEPFFSTKTGGFGLGLFIVANIIENYGGKLEVSSVEKQGTEVTVYLPV
jgi:signal transduction histidine kinase